MENKYDFAEVMACFYAALAMSTLLLSVWLWNDYLNGLDVDTSWLIILPINTVFSAAVSIAGIISKENKHEQKR